MPSFTRTGQLYQVKDAEKCGRSMGVHVLWEAVQSENEYLGAHRGVPHGNPGLLMRDV